MAPDATDPPEKPGGTAPHVIVDEIDHPVLCAEDVHHLAKVRRLRNGDLVSATDGRGSWRWCAFENASLAVVGDISVEPEPSPRLTVGFALVKGSKPELVVQKLSELGIDTIIPFIAERSVVRWDDAKTERQGERLTKVAREASMQSRRVWLPTVAPVARLSDLISSEGVVRADRDGRALSSADTTVLIGPEGGWSPAEADTTSVVGLGHTVLRAETAAIAAATLMVALRDGFVS
jgi:16S rRNA (uracil1498-N3)-methyltransferase